MQEKSSINKYFNSDILKPKIFLALFGIFFSAIIIRLAYVNFEVPLTLDSLEYFFYASDILITGKIPNDYTIANNGWAMLLSGIFWFFQFENIINYMNLQKIISISISSLTIFPIYIFARKYVSIKHSILGAFIFAIEPHLIQNSLFGISDSLYIFLIVISFCFFISNNKKLNYLAFLIAGFSTIVRSEGLFLMLGLSIMFIIKYKNEKFVFPKYTIALALFLLVVLPMSYYKYDVKGEDGIFMRAGNSFLKHTDIVPESNVNSGFPFIHTGIENYSKFFVWNMIPIFGFFVPFGIYFLLKNRNFEKKFLIVSAITMSLPTFYAYSIPLLDGRYFYFLFPIFCIVSLLAIEKFSIKMKNENIIIICIIIGITIASNYYLYEKINNEHEIEVLKIAKIISMDKK